MLKLIVFVEAVDLWEYFKIIGQTYQLFSIFGWEAHLVTRLGLVEEVRAPLQEREHTIEESIDSIASLLGDLHERLVVHLLELRVNLRHTEIYTIIINFLMRRGFGVLGTSERLADGRTGLKGFNNWRCYSGTVEWLNGGVVLWCLLAGHGR